jgi:hypothetical protein
MGPNLFCPRTEAFWRKPRSRKVSQPFPAARNKGNNETRIPKNGQRDGILVVVDRSRDLYTRFQDRADSQQAIQSWA